MNYINYVYRILSIIILGFVAIFLIIYGISYINIARNCPKAALRCDSNMTNTYDQNQFNYGIIMIVFGVFFSVLFMVVSVLIHVKQRQEVDPNINQSNF